MLVFGRSCPREKLSLSVKELLTITKKVQRFPLTFSLKISLRVKGKGKRNLLTKIPNRSNFHVGALSHMPTCLRDCD